MNKEDIPAIPFYDDEEEEESGYLMPKEELGKIKDNLKHLDKLRKILDGLTTFAEIRDAEDAGDWIVVVQTADLVRRSIQDVKDNIAEAIVLRDHGDL